MAKDKKSFVLYSDYEELFEELSNEDAGKLIKHIFKYVNDRNPETDDSIVKISFIPIKQQLKRDLKKYEEKKIQWSDAGKASAEARRLLKESQQSLTDVENRSTDSTVNDTVIDNVNDTVIDIKKVPTLEDFKNFAVENCKDINIESVELKYKAWVANDWKDGKDKKIKNWKTKILNTLTYLPKNEKGKEGFQNDKGSYATSKNADIPTGDCSTEWSK